jgi:pimeloyl-ACP methyl ester carboxylesterase
MHTVTSPDGTRIAYWRAGSGPALLLVHGATAHHSTTWRFVGPKLERQFTVYGMDRRGRGASGDADDYALQREAEDIAAVIEAIGEPVHLLGHSFGALCSLEAARLTNRVRRLILYEGVPLEGQEKRRSEALARLEALLRAGDLDRMLVEFYRDIADVPPDEIALLRSQQDAWAARMANARTVPREVAEVYRYVFDPDRFRNLKIPTLLLVGGDSPPIELEYANGVAALLPDATVVVLEGQQHLAMYTAPDLFVREVASFLRAS